MVSSLYDVRRCIRETKSSISSKEKYIRDKNKRVNDIDKIINNIYGCSGETSSINSMVDTVISDINDAISIDRFDFSSQLVDIKEKDCYSDSNLSGTISDLSSEKSLVNNQINMAKSQLSTLENKLSNLRREETRVILDGMKG